MARQAVIMSFFCCLLSALLQCSIVVANFIYLLMSEAFTVFDKNVDIFFNPTGTLVLSLDFVNPSTFIKSQVFADGALAILLGC